MHKYKYQSKVIDMFVSKVSQTLTVFTSRPWTEFIYWRIIERKIVRKVVRWEFIGYKYPNAVCFKSE